MMKTSELSADQYLDHWIKNQIWTHLEWPKHQQRFKTIAQHLKGKAFLDVGCAFGHSTEQLKKFRPGVWHGLDFSKRAIVKAWEFFPAMTFYYAENFDLSRCTQRMFDSTVCSEVLEHIDEDWKLLQGLMRITRKVLVISTPCIPVDDPGHIRLYTKDSLSELLGANKRYHYEIIEDNPFFFARVWHKKVVSGLKIIM